jgi:hypothetical protein
LSKNNFGVQLVFLVQNIMARLPEIGFGIRVGVLDVENGSLWLEFYIFVNFFAVESNLIGKHPFFSIRLDQARPKKAINNNLLDSLLIFSKMQSLHSIISQQTPPLLGNVKKRTL